MKKIIIILAAITVLISCSNKLEANSSKDTEKRIVAQGDWDINPKYDNSIDKEIKEVFNNTAKKLLGVKRELILYLGSQSLDGMNYAFVCRSSVVYPSALPYYEIIICNVSPQNEMSIVKIEKIIESSQSSTGGIVCTASSEAKINTSNSKEANDIIKVFKNAVKDVKDVKYTQELYVAKQVVKDTNYYFIASAELNDGTSSIKLITINNFTQSSEIIDVKDIL